MTISETKSFHALVFLPIKLWITLQNAEAHCMFGHVPCLSEAVLANQALQCLHCHVDAPLGRPLPLRCPWKRRHGRARNSWLEQICQDFLACGVGQSSVYTERRYGPGWLVTTRHRRLKVKEVYATRWWWWWWWWWYWWWRRVIEFLMNGVRSVLVIIAYICYSECVNVYICWNFQGIYTFPDSLRDCIYSLIFSGNLHIPWKIELTFWHIPWKCYFKQAS